MKETKKSQTKERKIGAPFPGMLGRENLQNSEGQEQVPRDEDSRVQYKR
jgi:hypothetical protein